MRTCLGVYIISRTHYFNINSYFSISLYYDQLGSIYGLSTELKEISNVFLKETFIKNLYFLIKNIETKILTFFGFHH